MNRTFLTVTLAALFIQTAHVRAQDGASFRAAADLLAPPLAAKMVEATGQRGTSQPEVWRFVVVDPASRTGVSVVEVNNRRLKGRDAESYVGGGNLPVFSAGQIKTDSTEVFEIANREAIRAGIGFDSLDYALRINATNGKPTWVATLLNRSNQPLGNVYISPETGRVTRVENLYGRPNTAPASTTTTTTSTTTTTRVQVKAPSEPVKGFERAEGFFQKTGQGFERAEYFFKKGARTAGGTLQEFFTGRRTIDRKYWNNVPVE